MLLYFGNPPWNCDKSRAPKIIQEKKGFVNLIIIAFFCVNKLYLVCGQLKGGKNSKEIFALAEFF